LEQHRDFQPREVVAQAEVLAAAEGQRPLDAAVPDEDLRVGVLALVAAGRGEQADNALPGLDRGVVNGEGTPSGSGEPLRGCAVPG
jgi:hypothetical protein